MFLISLLSSVLGPWRKASGRNSGLTPGYQGKKTSGILNVTTHTDRLQYRYVGSTILNPQATDLSRRVIIEGHVPKHNCPRFPCTVCPLVHDLCEEHCSRPRPRPPASSHLPQSRQFQCNMRARCQISIVCLLCSIAALNTEANSGRTCTLFVVSTRVSLHQMSVHSCDGAAPASP